MKRKAQMSRAIHDTLFFFYKNILYKKIKAEIRKILKIF